jgi:hypothetical protein
MNPMDQQHNPMQPNQMMNQMGNWGWMLINRYDFEDRGYWKK